MESDKNFKADSLGQKLTQMFHVSIVFHIFDVKLLDCWSITGDCDSILVLKAEENCWFPALTETPDLYLGDVWS